MKKARNDKFIFPQIDIVTGGFPCQDFSVSGWRKGLNSHKNHINQVDSDVSSIESRGMLYYWLREAVSIIKPKLFIAENVKGLLSMNQVKEVILNDFRNINDGYIVLEPLVLNMADYGVPQNREREIFIGVSKEHLSQSLISRLMNNEVDLYPEPTHISDYVKLRDVIGDLPEPEYSLDMSQQKYSKARWYGKHCQGQIEVNLDGLAPTIRSEHH